MLLRVQLPIFSSPKSEAYLSAQLLLRKILSLEVTIT